MTIANDVSPAKFLRKLAKRNLSSQEKLLIELYRSEEDIEEYKEYIYRLSDDYEELYLS